MKERRRIQRFEVAGQLGSGAMGTVYRARDPQLERDVAIKVLALPAAEARAQLSDRNTLDLRGPAATSELLTEARMMAKLSHPNVLPVYEVGLDGSDVFVVMELISGPDLRAWLATAHMPRAIRDVLAQAARGLAAAHACGIVHRDFKPENVLVGDDGRVRVADFGLSQLSARAARLRVEEDVGGTPAYMAPELWQGAPATSQSDVFAFCTVFVEAFGGERGLRDIEPRLRALVLAGIARDPATRPSLDALIAACERRRVSAWWLAAPAFAAIGGVALIVARTGEPACAADGVRFAGVWGDERHAALAALGASALDTERRGLDTALAATCTAERSSALTHPVALERTSCLERRGFELDAIAKQIGAGRTAKPQVQAMLETLPPHNCDAISAPVLPRDRDAIAALYARYVTTQLMPLAAPERVPALAQLEHDARDAGERELEAYAALSLGTRQIESDDVKAADASLGRAYDRAIAIHSSAIAMGALIERTIAADKRGDPNAAKIYAQLAIELADKPGAPSGQRLQAYYALAMSDLARGDARDAIEPLRKAHEIVTASGHRLFELSVGLALINALEDVHGDGAEILKLARQNLTLARDAYGEHGIDYGTAFNVLGIAQRYNGQPAEALASRKQALAIMLEHLAPSHSQVLYVRQNIADDLEANGQFEEARSELAAVLDDAKAVGAAVDRQPEMLAELGMFTFETGRTEEGFRIYERGVEQIMSKNGQDHPETQAYRYLLLNLELELRRFDDAARHADSLEASYRARDDARGLAKLDGAIRARLALVRHRPRDAETLARRALASLGELHEVDTERANILIELATSLVDQHKWADALPLLDQATAIGRARHYVANDFAVMDIQRARALAGQGHIADARSLAKSARAALDKFPGELTSRADADALLAHLR